jgi:hypothetical protein
MNLKMAAERERNKSNPNAIKEFLTNPDTSICKDLKFHFYYS